MVTFGAFQNKLESFYNSWKCGAIYSLLPILNCSDTLSELKLKKAYTVYILETYIPLLQFNKYIMSRSLLKHVWKGFEIILRHYVIFKNLNFIHINSPGSFHTIWELSWCYEWLISKLYFRFFTYGTDFVKCSCWKRCFINQIKASEWHILLFVFISN